MGLVRKASPTAYIDNAHRCPRHGVALVVPVEVRTDGRRRLALRLGRKICPLCVAAKQ